MTETPVGASPATRSNLPELSVSELSQALKRNIEQNFSYVRVRGEISGLKRHSSGHVYLTLKDEDANLDGVIWRGTVGRIQLQPADGMEVVCTGRLTTYPSRSRYQLVIESVELAGVGALLKLLEDRRKKLAAEGLFDEARKKKLPYLPDVIGVVTSPTGAVIRDILHRLSDRFPRHVIVWPVRVQGEGSAEEIVVRAAADSMIPLISAVGHETDVTLIDFVSDKRAPTPTAAAEMAVPVKAELLMRLDGLARRSLSCWQRAQDHRRTELRAAARALPKAEELLAIPRQRLDGCAERLPRALRANAQIHHTQLSRIAGRLAPQLLRTNVERRRVRLDACTQRLGTALKTYRETQLNRVSRARERVTALHE